MAAERPEKRPRLLKKEHSGDASLMMSASLRVTDPESIKQGTLLPHLAEENLELFQELLPDSYGPALREAPLSAGLSADADDKEPVTLTWGSCCSGSEGVRYVVDAANRAMNQAGLPVCFEHKFSCPVFDHVPKALGHRPGCIFSDIRDMSNNEALCCMHNQCCPVPHVTCLFVGTSCKDLSRANPSVDRSQH